MVFMSKKKEVIEFKSFIRKERIENDPNRIKPFPLLAVIPFKPLAMIDPFFLTVVAGIVAVALLEKGFANQGNVAIAEAVHTFLKIAFPIVGFAALYFLITQLSFLGW